MRYELALELGGVGLGILWLFPSPPLSAWNSGTVLAARPSPAAPGEPLHPQVLRTPEPMCPDTCTLTSALTKGSVSQFKYLNAYQQSIKCLLLLLIYIDPINVM